MLETLEGTVLLQWFICPIFVVICEPVKYTVESDGGDCTFELADAGNTSMDRTFVHKGAGNASKNDTFANTLVP